VIEKREVAVIGCGYWGRNLVRVFDEIGALKVVCDERKAVQEYIEKTYPNVETMSNFSGVISDDRISSVVIATPAVTHYELAKQALESGKDVFVEKPLALDVQEGKSLVDFAKKAKRILMAAVLKLKELIDGGELGSLRYIASHRLNFGKIRSEENVLWSFAPHDISLILGLSGEYPKEIHCHGGCYLDEKIADVTSTKMTFPGGLQAHLFMSWLHPFKEQKLVVVGEKKMAVFDDMEPEDKLVLYAHSVSWDGNLPLANKARGETVSLDLREPLRRECNHFIDCVKHRKEPRTNGGEGLRVLSVLRACQWSLENGKTFVAKSMKEVLRD